MRPIRAAALLLLLCLVTAARADAQQAPIPESVTSEQQIRIGDALIRYVGHFEYERGDLKMYADTADLFRDDDRAVLAGNVVLRQGTNQISADRADFNTK